MMYTSLSVHYVLAVIGKLCVYSLLQLWLCLAALCVIDNEHAEALSSGQWLGQDGKPNDKVKCQFFS